MTTFAKCTLALAVGCICRFTGAAEADSASQPYSMGNLPPILGAEQYGSRVLLLDTNQKDWNTPKAVLWNWHPVFDTVNLPPVCIPWFGGITDAKPVMNMTHLLITGSCGAVTLVRMKDKYTVFCVFSRGSHSAELLPDGNVVSAAAGRDGHLEIFDISTYDPMHPETTRKEMYPLPHIHGMVWDHKENCLWVDDAIGISRWEYTAKPFPSLKMTDRYSVPGFDKFWGHDLYPVPGTRKLFLTGDGISVFDTETKNYERYSDVIVKSISQAYPGGPVVVAVPEEQWWTENAQLLEKGSNQPQPFRKRSNMRFYKFRFFIHNEFSYGKLEKPEK